MNGSSLVGRASRSAHAPSLELAVAPLDAARRVVLQAATRSVLLTRVLGRRDSRIALFASVQVTALFALAVRAPVALFYLGPVVFGVAHLAADVRYLVLQRRLARAPLVASASFALAITALRAATVLHRFPARHADTFDVGLGVAWILALLVLGAREAGERRTRGAPALLVGSVALAAGVFLVAHARIVQIVLIHAHNLIAIALWLVLFRRRPGWTLAPVALALVFAGLLFGGALLPWTFDHGGFVAFGAHAEPLAASLAPGAPPVFALALLSLFVFLQGVHYATWTNWIPQDALRGEGTPTFRMSVRALARDFGPAGLAVVVFAALGFAAFSLWNVRAAAFWYVTLAKSHAWLECAFAVYLATRGRRSPPEVA
ncbi:MAG TPA: hypothetical protein VGI39_01655 [Polyangiaceae bacterium]